MPILPTFYNSTLTTADYWIPAPTERINGAAINTPCRRWIQVINHPVTRNIFSNIQTKSHFKFKQFLFTACMSHV